MKKTLLLIAVLSTGAASSQSLTPEVISSSGSTFTTGSSQLDWTLGETGAADLTAASIQLTQGFHQPELLVTVIDDLAGISVSVYPNPVLTSLNVLQAVPGASMITLYTVEGKLLYSENAAKELTTIPMDFYTAGNYILKISTQNGKHSLFKITKTN